MLTLNRVWMLKLVFLPYDQQKPAQKNRRHYEYKSDDKLFKYRLFPPVHPRLLLFPDKPWASIPRSS